MAGGCGPLVTKVRGLFGLGGDGQGEGGDIGENVQGSFVVAVSLEDGFLDVLNLIGVFGVADDLMVDITGFGNAEGVVALGDEIHAESAIVFVDEGAGGFDVFGCSEKGDVPRIDGLAGAVEDGPGDGVEFGETDGDVSPGGLFSIGQVDGLGVLLEENVSIVDSERLLVLGSAFDFYGVFAGCEAADTEMAEVVGAAVFEQVVVAGRSWEFDPVVGGIAVKRDDFDIGSGRAVVVAKGSGDGGSAMDGDGDARRLIGCDAECGKGFEDAFADVGSGLKEVGWGELVLRVR